MTRRELLAAAAACAPPLRARSRMDRSRISAITDEIGLTTDDAIAFAHHYGFSFIELRNPPGSRREYFQLGDAEIKADALRFAREGLKVSFLNTSLLKFTWPGTEPARARQETAEARKKRLAADQARWDNRMADLARALRCAGIMGCDKVRVFTGTRVAAPASVYGRIADTLGEMALAAQKEKIRLLIENEPSQNISGSREMADIMKLLPSQWIALNWDPHNLWGRETAFPDGYRELPAKRILNVQVKAKGVMPSSPEKEDWKAIMLTLDKDGYKGKIGLETHIFDGTLIAAANTSMEEIMRIVREIS
jgi:sugar phosphate isomerase/epimerase